MANDKSPNSASEKHKAEGERLQEAERLRNDTPGDVAHRYDDTGDEGGGITNRPLDEEISNQETLPERGRTKGEQPNRARQDREDVVSRERTGNEEPSRRYDEDVERNPALPDDDDPTLRTTI